MRTALACVGIALGLAACHPRRPPPQRVALDCPRAQGQLRRTSITSDGRTCTYVSARGDEVSLRLVPVSGGDVEAALAPIEQSLVAQSRAAPASGEAESSAAERARAEARADAGAGQEPEDQGAAAGTQTGPDHVTVDLPGIHVSANDGGANVKVGGIAVDAQNNGAVVRTSHAVRLRGEAFSREKRGYRASFILARSSLPGGFSAVGFEAGGPRIGPLAVAVVKSRGGDQSRLHHDVTTLVRRNGAV